MPITPVGGGQPNWFAVRDADTAVHWIEELQAWHDRAGVYLLGKVPACWPLHPRVVAEILALHQLDAAAHSDSPSATMPEVFEFADWLKQRYRLGDQSGPFDERQCAVLRHSPREEPLGQAQIRKFAEWWTGDRDHKHMPSID